MTIDKPDPWDPDMKVSDDFLAPVFQNFYKRLGLPNMMRKTDYHKLTPYVAEGDIDTDICDKLNLIAEIAERAVQPARLSDS